MSGLGQKWNVSSKWLVHGSHLQRELWSVRLLVWNQFGELFEFSVDFVYKLFTQEEQVVGSNSYSDYKKKNFDCGRFKLLTEINGEESSENTKTESQPKNDDSPVENIEDPTIKEIDEDILDLRENDIADDFVFYFTLENKDDYFCGATIINDRWIVAAAHCYNDFDSEASNKAREVIDPILIFFLNGEALKTCVTFVV